MLFASVNNHILHVASLKYILKCVLCQNLVVLLKNLRNEILEEIYLETLRLTLTQSMFMTHSLDPHAHLALNLGPIPCLNPSEPICDGCGGVGLSGRRR